MHVIWAKGQEQKNYQHSPKSGLEKDVSLVKDFYKPDELKYHGHGSQRGVISINFFGEFSTFVTVLGGRARGGFNNRRVYIIFIVTISPVRSSRRARTPVGGQRRTRDVENRSADDQQ